MPVCVGKLVVGDVLIAASLSRLATPVALVLIDVSFEAEAG
jgi:hypothetical protein